MSIISDKKIQVSKNNRYNNILASGETYTGIVEINGYTQILVSVLCSGTATLYIEFSPNNNDWNVYEQKITANVFDQIIRTCSVMYVRIRLVNTAGTDIDVVLNSYFGDFGSATLSQLDSSLNNTSQAQTVKAILYTQHLNGEYLPVQSYYNRGVNVSIINPVSAFGEIITAKFRPYVQMQFSYYNGAIVTNNLFNIFKNNSSTSQVRHSNLMLTSGCNYGDYSIIQSKKFLKYNSGQGVRIRASMLFSPPREGHQQAVGFGDKANGYFLYNNGTGMSCLRRTSGSYEIHKVVITGTSATSTGIITIILNGVPNYILVTSGQTLATIVNNFKTAPTIKWYNYGWDIFVEGQNIYIKSINPMAMSGTFSIASTATGITATITRLVDGANYTEYEIERADWYDPCNNTVFIPTIDFTLGNVFDLNFQWLGYGKIAYNLENPQNGLFQLMNTFQYANNNGRPTIANPNGYLIAGSQNTRADISSTITTPASDINTISNTITITGHGFATGDFVTYNNSSTNGVVPTTNTKTFNGSSASVVFVNGRRTIYIPNHNFKNGEQVVYSNGGGTSIGGLTTNTIYYIIYRDDNHIQLASSLANVSTYTAIALNTVGVGISHTLSSWRYYIHVVDEDTVQLKTHFNDISAITLSATGTRLLKLLNCYVVNIDGSSGSHISGTTVTLTGHGLQDNETVKYINYSSGTAIGGLTDDDIYYVDLIDENSFYLCEYKKGEPITLTVGTGTQHFFAVVSSFSTASMAIFNEGDIIPDKLQKYALNGRNTTILSTSTDTDIPMIAIFVRKNLNGSNNTVPVLISRLAFSYSKDSINDKEFSAQFNVYLNPTFTTYNNANAFTAVDGTNSVCNYSLLSATDRVSGGKIAFNSFTRVGGVNYPINDIELQPGDMLVICGKSINANKSVILDCSVSWYENF